jgi:hypothetical protein
MRALLAAMQGRIAFGADTVEIGSRRERGGTVEAPRCRDMLNEARKAGSGYIERGARTLRLGPFLAATRCVGVAVRVHVPVLSILAVAIHGEGCSVTSRKDVL